MIGGEGLQPRCALFVKLRVYTHPMGPVPLLALQILPLLQACSRTWLRAASGRGAACWMTPHPHTLSWQRNIFRCQRGLIPPSIHPGRNNTP